MNKLASIQKIHSIVDHPNADTLSCAFVMSWPVVVKRGQFKDGESIVFVEIDSIVPENNSYFEFMRKQKFRVWNARFRGCPSSGLVCPLSILDNHKYLNAEWIEGYDVSEILGITKYERPIDISMGGDAVGNFPTNLISISDEDNMLSYSSALTELEGKDIYISSKVDGSSTTFIYNNGEFKACSRRLELKEGSGFPWTAAIKYDIKNKLATLGRNLAIQAECIGPKLNGNTMELKELEIRVFRIKNLDKREIVNFYELSNLCTDLNLPMVDIINTCKFNKDIHTVEYFRNLADSQIWKTNNKSGEGIVIAPITPFHSYILNKSWSLKVINQNYK